MKKSLLLFCLFTLSFSLVHAQIITTVAGHGVTGTGGNGGPATAAAMYNPYGVTVDAAGNLYIADQWNHLIRKVNTGGIITLYAGTIGFSGFSGDGGQATAAELNYPSQVYVDAGGNLFIADEFNSCIRKIAPSGIITTVAGIGGVSGYSGDGGPATAAELNYCTDMTFDAAGNMYIADYTGQRVRKVTPSGIITTIAGTGTIGFSGDGGAATAATFDYPYGVAVDGSGNVFVSDRYNNRIRKIDAGGIITTIAGNGTPSLTGDGGPATAATVNNVFKVFTDAAGDLYVADFGNAVIREINTSGIIKRIAGNGIGGFSGDGGPATAAELNEDGGVFVTPSGDIYIGDNLNERIRKITTVCSLSCLQTQTNPKCFGQNTGSAIVIASFGKGSYTYSWSNGQTIFAATGLSAGTYTCIVTDSGGCKVTNTVTITQPAALTGSKTITNALCSYTLGEAKILASGGTSAYTYAWAPSGGTNATASNLSAGTYTCTVTDNNGCVTADTVTLTQPAAISAGTSTVDASCGGSNGSATVIPGGGTGAYTYNWAPGGNTNAIATNLSAASYTVTITDANGCTQTASTIVNDIGAPSVTITHSDLLCNNNNIGVAIAAPSGGTPPYSYIWAPTGSTTATVTGLSAGTYTCTTIDKNNCIVTTIVTITQPAALSVTAKSANATCANNNGTATVFASGGTGALTYSWAPSGGTNSAISGLSAGTYTCTVTDNSGCSETNMTTVALSLPSVSISSALTINSGDSVQLNAGGGDSYVWSPSTGLSCTTCANPYAKPGSNISYCVVMDSGVCADTACIDITVEIPCGEVFVANALSPNNDGKNDMLYVHGKCIMTMDFLIFDRWGNKVFESENLNQGWDGTYLGKPMNTGTYVYSLVAIMKDGSTVSKKGNITLVR